MDLENIKEYMMSRPNMATALGMRFISVPEEDECMATMDVDDNTCQPFGFISGGASLALAETLAGVGSLALCPGQECVGVSVSGNHVRTVAYGNTVTARAKLISRGRVLHVWEVHITDREGRMVSTVNVTNYIRTPKARKQQ